MGTGSQLVVRKSRVGIEDGGIAWGSLLGMVLNIVRRNGLVHVGGCSRLGTVKKVLLVLLILTFSCLLMFQNSFLLLQERHINENAVDEDLILRFCEIDKGGTSEAIKSEFFTSNLSPRYEKFCSLNLLRSGLLKWSFAQNASWGVFAMNRRKESGDKI